MSHKPIALAACFSLVVALGGCGASDGQDSDVAAGQAVAELETVPVSSVPVVETELVEPVYGTGSMFANRTTDVGPLVSGIIDQIYVQVGARVEAGAPLFRTRQVDFEIALEEAEQALTLAEAEVEKVVRDVKRIKRLRQQDVASQTNLDDVQTRRRVLNAKLGMARAALARARQNVTDTVVRAPFKGVVTARFVDEGIFMNTRFGGGSNSAVVQIQQIDPIVAIIQVAEVHLAKIHLGTPGIIRVDGIDRDYHDTIDILNDRIDHESRSVELRFTLANPDYTIKPGLFARAEITPEARRVLVTARRALLGVKSDYYVFVEANGKASRRAVQIRELDGKRAEIVEGLVAGDQVLVGPNLPRLRDGSPIVIETRHAAG